MATDSGQQDDGSAALAPFGSVEFCPKCGKHAGDAPAKWFQAQRKGMLGFLECKGTFTAYEVPADHPEHLVITCACGYAWREAPKDAEGKA